jgi:hypothetical protein
MTTTQYSAALFAALIAIGVAGWILWPRIAQLLDGPAPTVPEEPERDDQEERPASGADEEFTEELRAMRMAPVAPELISDTERDLAWGLAWHEFERAMQAEIDKAFAPFLAAAPVADDFDELREQTCPKELMAS